MSKKMQQPETNRDATAYPGGQITMADLGIADGGGEVARPRLQPTPAFLFLFHPERWTVLHGLVVPALKKLFLRNGVNRVRQLNDGRYVLSEALALQAKRGWKPLDPMIDGEAAYLYEATDGVWLSRWETAHAGSSKVTAKGLEYAQWLRKLIAERRISPPEPYALEELRNGLQSEIARLQDQVRSVPSVQIDLDAKLASLAALESELGDRTPKPIAKRPGKTNPLAGLTSNLDDDSE